MSKVKYKVNQEGIKMLASHGIRTQRTLEFIHLLLNTEVPTVTNLAKAFYVEKASIRYHVGELSRKLKCYRMIGIVMKLFPYLEMEIELTPNSKIKSAKDSNT
jgi:hypothetical protein